MMIAKIACLAPIKRTKIFAMLFATPVTSTNLPNIVPRRFPIKKDGKIVGAIGKIMFQDVDEFKRIANKIISMESKLKYYQEEFKVSVK
jgi:hypothetical protein